MISIALAIVCMQQSPLQEHFVPGLTVEREAVGPASSLEDEVPVSLMLYDVSDITGGSLAALRESMVRGATTTEQALEAANLMTTELHRMRQNLEQLVGAVKEMVEPPFDTERNRCGAGGDANFLLVGSAAQHAWVGEMLESCRVLDEMIDLRSKMFIVDAEQAAALEGAGHRALLAPAAAEKLSADLDRMGGEGVTSPSLLTFPYQLAELQILREIAYVSDYELKRVAEPTGLIADPVVDVAQAGLKMSVRGLPWKTDRVLLKVDLSYSVVKEPIPTFETRIEGIDASVTIQLPETTITRLDARLDLLEEETLVMRSPLPEGRVMIVLVQASRVQVPSPFDIQDEE